MARSLKKGPFVDGHLLKKVGVATATGDKRIIKNFHMYFRRADVIETSRGCLYHCNFCSIHQMYGSSIRQYPLERVLADIEDAYSRGARHIFCTDDNITQDMNRFEQLIDGVISLKLKNLHFTTQATVLGFSQYPQVIKKLPKAGFVSIFLGIENASTKNLRAMKKPNNLARTDRVPDPEPREPVDLREGP